MDRAWHESGLAKAHRALSDDVSVLSFQDDEFAASPRSGRTTLAIAHERTGNLAIEVLGAPGPMKSDLLVPMALHNRESIAAPKTSRGPAPHTVRNP